MIRKIFTTLLPLLAFFFTCYCVTTVWNWHAVPLGAGRMTLRHAAGFAALYGLFTAHPRPELDKYSYIRLATFSIATDALMLLVGWLAR